MRTILTLAALAAACLVAAPAWAADCSNPDSTAAIDDCAGKDFTAADGQLNVIYKQLFAKYDAANRTLLQTAQRSWLKFRDDECAYETGLSVGGTLHPAMETNCRAELTHDRVKRLNAQLHCAEGDLSCNPP